MDLTDYVVAGIIGTAFSDTVMHSLDTIKSRQQAAPNVVKYHGTINGYFTIWREEGFFRGLYSGYGAAMLGSIPRGVTFFGTYEFLKQKMIGEWHLNPTFTHIFSGMMGDLVTSVGFVPSEVLKTRLQAQGCYNNPYVKSGYNYRGLGDAIKTIIAKEGWCTFYRGYKATLSRDLPFSAMQFGFYEKFREMALEWEKTTEISMISELIVGGMAGGITGIITTPIDVVKTRIQTQTSDARALVLSNSVVKGLGTIYRKEGIKVLFSGVQPRFVWTFIQSSIMLLVYQEILKEIRHIKETRQL